MSWYAKSMGFIKKMKMENPGMSPKELRRHCSKNYPFRERSGFAYKAFLNAMRDEFGRAKRDPAPEKAGQTDFIGW